MKIDELPESIILKDEHFKIYLNTIIETVRNEIWKENLIKHYTKHGIDHSERIAQYLGKLLEGFPALLNQQERFVLLAAIFLHDIGNQLPRYAGIPIRSRYSTEELEKIRKNHHLSSCQAVKDSIKTNAELPLGLSLCKKYTDFIALLCKYHRKLDLKYLKDTSIAGDPLRLHLLGAFLRLGDELDADYRRVDMEVLNIIDIPTESKFYWWSHHYVQSISIVQGHIKLFFWFPEEYKNNNIVEVFKNKRKESLREQFLEVYDIFENYGVRLYRDIEIEDTNYLSAGSLKPVPPDLLDYIKTTITQTGSNYKELSFKKGVAWEIDGVLYSDNEKVVEALAKIPQLMNKYKYKEAVKIIEHARLLTMSPKDRMIFLGIAGNCYLSLCDFDKVKIYYNDQLKLSERKDLRNVYRLDTIFARSASLGNIGIIYQIQGKLKEAFQHYRKALDIYRKIGNKEGEANALGNMGIVYQIQGKLKEAFQHYRKALDIYRKIGNKEGEANALGNMGNVYQIQGKLKEALEHHQQALDIHRKIGNKEGVASDLGNMGNVYQIQGKLEEALEHHQQALDIDREIGKKEGEANQLCNMGNVYQIQGKLKEAFQHYRKALDIHREIGSKEREASDLGNMGIVYRIQGKPKEALEHHQQALDIDREIGKKEGEANQLCNMGIVYQTQGKLREALEYYQQALTIHRKIGNKEREANALGNMGNVYQIQGKLKEALEHHQQALDIHRKIGKKEGEASVLGNMGNVYQIQGKLKEAFEHHQQALEIDRKIGNKEGVASDLGNMGNVYQIQGKLKEAFEHHQQALDIHRKIGKKEGEASDLCNIGIIYKIQGNLKEALVHYQQALEIDRKIGNKQGEASDLCNMGNVYQIQGKPGKALSKFKEALEIFKTLESSENIEKITKIIKIVEEEIKNKVIDDIVQNNQEKSKIKENTKKPEIFLSYSHRDKEIADRVDKFFISKNIRLTRDVRDAMPYSSLKKFMDTIRDHDYVIMLISDAYLKSTNCMYEVIQFIQEIKYIEKTFPIIIDEKADIFKKEKHIDYIRFWQNKYKRFRDKINDLENTGTAQSHVELDKIDEIQSNIGKFLNKIADLKCFSLDELESTNYKAILDKIANIFNIPQKEEIRSTKDDDIWDKGWIMKRREEALAEMKKNEKLGFVEINTTLTNPENNKFECEKLKETFENTFLNNNQWPIGYLNKLINIYPKNDGIFFEIKDHLSDNLYLYGYIREDGAFYLIHSLFEDAKEYFDYILCESRIDRIVKALLFSIQFYQDLNIKPNSYLLIGIKHGGLKDRCIVHDMVDVRYHDPTLISTEDESYYEEELMLNKIEEQLVEIVERFSNKLFRLFNFYQVDKKIIYKTIKKIIS